MLFDKKNENETMYVPWSVEKKRCVMMYLLIWIFLHLSNKKTTVFELFHLKQSLWWWILFVFLFFLLAILMFIPLIRVVVRLFLFVMLLLWGRFVKLVRNGRYGVQEGSLLSVFYGIWSRVLDIFDIKLNVTSDNK